MRGLFRKQAALAPFSSWEGRAPFLLLAEQMRLRARCNGLDYGPASGAVLVSPEGGDVLLAISSVGDCSNLHDSYDVREMREGIAMGGKVWTNLKRCRRFVPADVAIVVHAAKLGFQTAGCHLYLTHSPSADSAAILADAGLGSIVCRGALREPIPIIPFPIHFEG